jgi:hypothetical protein
MHASKNIESSYFSRFCLLPFFSKKVSLAFLVFFVFLLGKALAQQEIFLRNKTTGRLIKLNSSKLYSLEVESQNKESESIECRIVDLTDSSLVIKVERGASKTEKVQRLNETLQLQNIKAVKRSYRNNDFFTFTAFILLVIDAAAIIDIPIEWIGKGEDAGVNQAEAAAKDFGYTAIVLAPHFIRTTKKMTKWEFVKK